MVSEFYRAPNGDDIKFMESLRELLAATQGYGLSFLCSDQNYDLLKLSQHKPSNDFFNEMINMEYVPMINKLTRVTHRSSTVIDNIYVRSKTMMGNCSYVIVDPMSDHYPCFVAYDLHFNKNSKPMVFEKRKLTEETIPKIQEFLLFFPWCDVTELSVDNAYEYLVSVVTEALDRFAPKRVVKVSPDERFREAWMTVRLQKYNNKCRKLCDKARKSGRECDHVRYKKYRNIVNRLKLHEKREHYRETFAKIGKNSKLIWSVINSLIKKVNNKTEVMKLVMDGRTLIGPKEICNGFNKHFATARKHVQDTIPEVTNSNSFEPIHQCKSNFKFKLLTEMRLCHIVSKMPAKLSCGIDGISNMLLKQLISVLKGPLCTILNMSLKQGIFPDLMKIAKVIPLHKGGLCDVPDNYRPISLLPVFSKILEKAVYVTLIEHLNNNDILYYRQYGFRKHHSTIDAVSDFAAEILNGFESDNMLLSVFIDLHKAFDTISHESILSKLERMGVSDIEIAWFRSYLSG